MANFKAMNIFRTCIISCAMETHLSSTSSDEEISELFKYVEWNPCIRKQMMQFDGEEDTTDTNYEGNGIIKRILSFDPFGMALMAI